MADQPPPTISQRIESTVEGLIRFVVRFLRTYWTLTVQPWRITELAAPTDTPGAFVYPLTFLTIGSFFFSLLIEIYPGGLIGFVDLIWFTEEIGEAIVENVREALSIQGLLLTGAPTLLSCIFMSYIVSWVTGRSDEQTRTIYNGCCYIFGYQAFGLFVLAMFVVFSDRISEIENFIESVSSSLSFYLLGSLLWVLILAPFFMPAVALAFLLIRTTRSRTRIQLASCAIAAPLIMIAGFSLYTTLASAGQIVTQRLSPAATPKLMFGNAVKINRVPDTDKARLTFDLFLENTTPKNFGVRAQEITVTLSAFKADPSGKEALLYDTRAEINVLFDLYDKPITLVVFAPNKIGGMRIRSEFEPPPKFLELLDARHNAANLLGDPRLHLEIDIDTVFSEHDLNDFMTLDQIRR